MFPGLMPTHGNFTIPSGFSPPREPPPPVNDNPDNLDLDEWTKAAQREWAEIRQAFDVFRTRLGPDFTPLGPDEHTAQAATPFGTALVYRTYSISGIWMNYYMGLIMLTRAHPTAPPIAMMAVGMMAQQTAVWANEVGRIAAGLYEGDCSRLTDVTTLLGAVFIESCFCSFVAGIQVRLVLVPSSFPDSSCFSLSFLSFFTPSSSYSSLYLSLTLPLPPSHSILKLTKPPPQFREMAQRHWIIRRLYNIARLTGWQSARQIADGCESAWVKAAQMGRGPEYHRPTNLGPLFPEAMSVWTRPRRIDRRIREMDGGGETRVVLARTEKSHYAMGLLTVEQDLERLVLDKDDE